MEVVGHHGVGDGAVGLLENRGEVQVAGVRIAGHHLADERIGLVDLNAVGVIRAGPSGRDAQDEDRGLRLEQVDQIDVGEHSVGRRLGRIALRRRHSPR
jgi:hypothetical protein